MFQAARYFDLQDFENFDTATATWTGQVFKGQQKVSDKFSSIYHRPTRKAMLYCANDVTPASVIRNVSSGEVFMVGALQEIFALIILTYSFCQFRFTDNHF